MTINEIHQRFFSFRNGIVAKAFHDAGAPYRRIFGLQIPQIGEIAREIGTDEETAEALWKEKECREARLLACYLFDPDKITIEKALSLAKETQTREECDILAWRLLRRMAQAKDLLPELDGYMAEALQRNLM